MNRRDLLVVGALTALAGCLGYEIQQTETITDRRVRIAELEATVEVREERIETLEREVNRLRRRLAGPRINAVSLVEAWERTGDVVVGAVDDVAAGDPLTVAVSFTYPTHGSEGGTGRVDVELVVELTDSDGRQVAQRERRVQLFLDPDATLAELPIRFGDFGLTPGTYAMTARVTDRVTGTETTAETITFRVQ